MNGIYAVLDGVCYVVYISEEWDVVVESLVVDSLI